MSECAAPSLSVTLTNYNYAEYLPCAIESIQRQTFGDFELIVIDNASTDHSLDVLENFAASDDRVRVIKHERNVGPDESLVESYNLCRGRYRVHVDADDWVISPTAFERQFSLLEKNPQMSFVISRLRMCDATGQTLHTARPFERDAVLTQDQAMPALLDHIVPNTGMMCRLSSYRQTAGWPGEYRHTGDMLMAVRLAKVGAVGYVDDTLYGLRQHGENINTAEDLSILRDEYLPVMAEAFASCRLDPATKRRILSRMMLHMPTKLIFGGQLRHGWRFWWEGVKLHPVATAAKPRTVALLVRTLLGPEFYDRLHLRVK